ncbi:hypothetical protein BSR03_02475 [Serratia proteamaculans]|nr:hypothetical protein BSR03_02475 [Serratia proteamaculans]
MQLQLFWVSYVFWFRDEAIRMNINTFLLVAKNNVGTDKTVREEEQRRLTLEALNDVEQLNIISHEEVQAWAINLDADKRS